QGAPDQREKNMASTSLESQRKQTMDSISMLHLARIRLQLDLTEHEQKHGKGYHSKWNTTLQQEVQCLIEARLLKALEYVKNAIALADIDAYVHPGIMAE